MTLKQLIKKLFKSNNLSPTKHFNVWICGYNPQKDKDIIDMENPFQCCHFLGFKKYVDMQGNRKIHSSLTGHKVRDGSDVFQWLEFDVEDFEFEISPCEYWLFVKLVDINNPICRCGRSCIDCVHRINKES